MDVFKIDRSLNGNLGRALSPNQTNPPEITFEAGSEFNLCYFDTPEDTRGGFSDPSSVGSTTEGGSPPPQLHLPPLGVSPGLLSPPGAPSSSITIKTEQHYAVADSNSSSTTKTFVPCKVCGDKASGYHYGVTSCEGCKGFFRRSIQKQIEYRCLRDGKCLVIRLNRNRCQYCRFKKCLAVGMSRDSVRYGRVPKRSREEQVTTADADQSEPEPKPVKKEMSVYDVLLVVTQAHLASCGYTEEKMRALDRKPLAPPPANYVSDAEVASTTADTSEIERCWLWQHFAVKVTPSVQKTVEFGKRLPGFSDLCQDDQLILIKIGFFEIWLSHVARWAVNNLITFDDGTTVSKQQFEVMYDTDFASSLFNFALTFSALSLDDAEMALFSAVVLLTADRVAITDVKAIENYREKIVEALKVQLDRNHPHEPQLLPNILTKIPELRSLGVKHAVHLEWFRMNWRKLSLPPLFAEIFDIPKPEDA